MKSGNPVFNRAIPAALIPFVAPLASFAAEGTGRVSYILNCKYSPIAHNNFFFHSGVWYRRWSSHFCRTFAFRYHLSPVLKVV